MANDRFKKIGGLWKKKKEDRTWLSGNIEIDGVRYPISVFPNNKKEDKQPDYRVTLDTENIKAVEKK